MEEYSHEIKSESCNPLKNSLTNLSLIGGQQFFSPFQISDGLFDLLFQSWIFFQLKIIKSTFQKSFHQAYRLKGKNRWIIKQNEVSVPPFSSPSVRALYLVFSIPQQELSCASFLDAASVLAERKHIQYRQRDQSLQTIDSTAYFCLLSSTVFFMERCALYRKLQEKQFNNGFIHSSSKGLLLGCLSSIAKLSFTCAWNISSCCSFQSSSSSAVLYSSVSRGSVTGGGLGWAGGTRCGSERGMALDVWLLSSEEERLY